MRNDFGAASRHFIVPQDPETREALYAIDNKTRKDVGERFNFIADTDWHCNTIAEVTLEAIICDLAGKVASDDVDALGLNFFNLFNVFVTIKVNENAEKEGNINIMFEPGSAAIALIDEDMADNEKELERVDPAQFFYVDDNKDLNERFARIERTARYIVDSKYEILLPDKLAYVVFGILYTFVENIFKYLLYKLGSDPEAKIASVNFNDLAEFHATRKKDGIVLTIRPGMSAKLLIKSDELTEDELIDDDV